MKLISEINRARELAGMKPLSEAQETTLSEAAEADWDAMATAVFRNIENSKYPGKVTLNDVKTWAKKYKKNNSTIPATGRGSLKDIAFMKDSFYEYYDH